MLERDSREIACTNINSAGLAENTQVILWVIEYNDDLMIINCSSSILYYYGFILLILEFFNEWKNAVVSFTFYSSVRLERQRKSHVKPLSD
jgi:hypothetical protein